MISRRLEGRLTKALEQYPVVSVLGPRQSGKTTLVRHYLPDFSYANLEDPELRMLALGDPKAFLKRFPPPAIFDEVQRAPDLLSYVQVESDRSGKKGQYVLTGSNQPELGSAISQSLAGRSAILNLLPLSLGELDAAGLSAGRDEAIHRGFLPRVVADGLDPTEAYGYYAETYVERDLRRLVNIRDLDSFRAFLRLLAGRVGQVLNLHALAGDIGVSSTTLKAWFSALEASFIVFKLNPYFSNRGKRLVKASKVYFYETGLAAALLGISSAEQVGRDPLLGGLFENMVVADILKEKYNSGAHSGLCFYRDPKGYEIDLVIEERGRLVPIEIKAGTSFHPELMKSLKSFGAREADAEGGILAYGGDESFEYQGMRVLSFRGIARSVFPS
jgi:hypothetical protein